MRARRTLDGHDAVDDLQVGGIDLERVRRDVQCLLLDPLGRQVDRRATHHRGARGERADGVRHPAGVTRDHLDVLELHPELVGDQLGEHGGVALPLRGEAGGDLDLAGGLDVDVRTFVGTDAGALDVAGEADAHLSSLRRHLRLVRRELVPADQGLDLLQQRGIVAGVVLQLAAVLEDQAVVERELVGLDEVDRPHLGAVLAEVRRDRVHRPLHRVAALRSPGPTVGSDHHRVGVERLEDHPVVLRLVGAEQLGRGDDRHDQPVRREGAVVVPEVHAQAVQPPVVVEAHLDVVHLRALVCRGDEVLAPVLGELHRPAEGARGERDEQLLGPRVVDLHAEAAADVGGDHVDLTEVEPHLHRQRGAHAGGGLGGGPHLRAGCCRGPSAPRSRDPPWACWRCARWSGRARAGAVRSRSRPGRHRRSAPASLRRCRGRRHAPGHRRPSRPRSRRRASRNS